MSITKGGLIDAAEYNLHTSTLVTNPKSAELKTTFFGTDDISTNYSLYTRSTRTSPDYNFAISFRAENIITPIYTVVFFFTKVGDLEPTFFWALSDAAPLRNLDGWRFDYDGPTGATGFFPVRETYTLDLYIPPSDDEWDVEVLLGNQITISPHISCRFLPQQAQNTVVAGEFVKEWDTDFSALVPGSSEDGLSYDKAIKGLYGQEV